MSNRFAPVAFISVVLAAPLAGAQTVEVNITNPDARRVLARNLGQTEQELETFLENEFRALYGVLEPKEFLRLSANAQSLAGRGLGVDYASNPNSWVFGVAATGAVSAGDADLDEVADVDRSVPVSAGAQLAGMVGYNFGDAGAPGLTLFASGLYFPLTFRQFEGRFTNFGLHGQYRIIGEKNAAAIGWGGISLTSGLQFSRVQMNLAETNYEASADLGSGISLDTVSTGVLDLEQRAWTVPIELTTNVTFLKFLTLYAGVGFDFLFGAATANLDLTSELRSTIDGTDYDVGDGRILIDDESDSDPYLVRFMGGIQFNIWIAKLFVQVNVVNEEAAVGLAAGLRIAL